MSATIDIEQQDELLGFLRDKKLIEADERPQFRPLSGGISNRTVWIGRPGGEDWVAKQALNKLRVPVDWFSSPERIHREAAGLRWLTELAPPNTIPPLVFEDHDQHLLIMQAVPLPHDNWKQLLLAGQLERDYIAQFGRLLATIHRNGYLRRQEVGPHFEDRSFFESLRLEPYYSYAATQVPAAAAFLDALINESRNRSITLVHGDYSPKNILVYDAKLVLLDHEVIHFGDPAFDLGFSLTHFLSKAHHLQPLRRQFAEAASYYWRVYFDIINSLAWADGLEDQAIRHTLACLLARVDGRSVLEYLEPEERIRQQQAVLDLISNIPPSIPDLINQFVERVTNYANH